MRLRVGSLLGLLAFFLEGFLEVLDFFLHHELAVALVGVVGEVVWGSSTGGRMFPAESRLM